MSAGAGTPAKTGKTTNSRNTSINSRYDHKRWVCSKQDAYVLYVVTIERSETGTPNSDARNSKKDPKWQQRCPKKQEEKGYKKTAETTTETP
jgi:hypothetical protein